MASLTVLIVYSDNRQIVLNGDLSTVCAVVTSLQINNKLMEVHNIAQVDMTMDSVSTGVMHRVIDAEYETAPLDIPSAVLKFIRECGA